MTLTLKIVDNTLVFDIYYQAKKLFQLLIQATSTNVRISSKNFLTYSFNPFATLVQNFKFAPSASPKLLYLNQDHTSKKQFFLSNPYKMEVIITSLIETPDLSNLGHMTTSTI